LSSLSRIIGAIIGAIGNFDVIFGHGQNMGYFYSYIVTNDKTADALLLRTTVTNLLAVRIQTAMT
jgi:hypothetical protein